MRKFREALQGRKVVSAIREKANAKGLNLECTRLLQESMLILTLKYSNETEVRKKKKIENKALQIDNLRGMLEVRRIEKIGNKIIRDLSSIKKKSVTEVVSENILRLYGQIKKKLLKHAGEENM